MEHPANRNKRWTSRDEAELRQMHTDGRDVRFMALMLERTPATIERRLKDFWLSRNPDRYVIYYGAVTPAAVLAGEFFGVSLDEMRGDRRLSQQAWARQVAMWLARKKGCGISHVARFFRRDHTTVTYAGRRVDARRQAEPMVRQATDALLAALLENAPAPSPAIVLPLEPPPPPSRKTRTSDAPDAAEAAFYDRAEKGGREFLEEQNARFAAAMTAAGERP
jgi:hypothetical protein